MLLKCRLLLQGLFAVSTIWIQCTHTILFVLEKYMLMPMGDCYCNVDHTLLWYQDWPIEWLPPASHLCTFCVDDPDRPKADLFFVTCEKWEAMAISKELLYQERGKEWECESWPKNAAEAACVICVCLCLCVVFKVMSGWVVCCPGPSFFVCVFVIGLRKKAFNFSYKGKAMLVIFLKSCYCI